MRSAQSIAAWSWRDTGAVGQPWRDIGRAMGSLIGHENGGSTCMHSRVDYIHERYTIGRVMLTSRKAVGGTAT
jgi:hypothetical protein